MSETEDDLVRKAQRGDRLAFEELVRLTSRLLYARLYLDTGDPHRTEDLVQETYLAAYRSLGRLQEPSHLRSWLLAIAQNLVIDTARREHRRKRTAPERVPASALASVPGPEPPPEEQAERAEQRDRVLAVLRSLPEEYRLPLTLRYLAGADYETISIQLGLSNGSLRGLLHRGLKMLRARLEPELGRE